MCVGGGNLEEGVLGCGYTGDQCGIVIMSKKKESLTSLLIVEFIFVLQRKITWILNEKEQILSRILMYLRELVN